MPSWVMVFASLIAIGGCEKQDAGVAPPQRIRSLDAAAARPIDAAARPIDAAAAHDAAPVDASNVGKFDERFNQKFEQQLLKALDESTYQPPAAFTACTRDDECVVTRASCGTNSFAVHRAHADEARAAAERLCKVHVVADVLDVKPIPACRAGHCVNAAHGATRTR